MTPLYPPSAQTRHTALRLADLIQCAGVEAFRSDRQASPSDLIAAHVYALALAIAAVDTATDSTSTLDAAIAGLRATVQRATELARTSMTLQ